MPVVQLVSEWNIAHVPPFPVVSLVTAKQNHRAAARIEGEQGAQVPSRRTELFQVVVPRAANRGRARATETWPVLPQMLDRFPDVIGILRPQAAEPSLCLRCELDLPRHPGSVMSPPVTEQDAFVPLLSNDVVPLCTVRRRRMYKARTFDQRTRRPGHKHVGDAYVPVAGFGRGEFGRLTWWVARRPTRRVPSAGRYRPAIRSRCRRPSQGPPSRRGCCPA